MSESLQLKQEYSKQEIVNLLKSDSPLQAEHLAELANEVRIDNFGKSVFLSEKVCISNNCNNNCLYCEQRRCNEALIRKVLSKDNIIKAAIEAEKQGCQEIILESGECDEFNIETLVQVIKEIKNTAKIRVSLELGEKTELEYRKLKEAGADSYILNHQTSDPILYRQLHPDLKYSDRIKCIRTLKKLGFQTGSGILVGIPGQTFESIANDILMFKEFEIDIINILPYIPCNNTPLEKKFSRAGGYFVPAIGFFQIDKMISRIISVARLVNPNSNLTAYYSIIPADITEQIEMTLASGANAIVTSNSLEYKKHNSDKKIKEIIRKVAKK